MKIVISIAPRSMKEAVSALRKLRRSGDLVEVRVDRLRGVDLEKLLRHPRPRVIVTNRRRSEGGFFTGSARAQARTLSDALGFGAEYADIELRAGSRLISRLLEASANGRLIVSYHDTRRTPRDLHAIMKRLLSSPGNILKLVTTASDISDNRRIFDLLERSHRYRRPIAAFCMSGRGEISRILGPRFGGELAYAASAPGKITAPGQLTAADLRGIYRVHTLNRRSKIFGLVGNPVSHSKGYLFHNGIFAQKGLNAVYVNFLVEDLERFFRSFGDLVSGLSVTMPFKKQVIPLLDSVDEEAELLQSVNTILRKKGRLVGCNTDYPAVRRILRKGRAIRGKHALVLGTGATSRSMALAALDAGASATIVGRSSANAENAARRLSCSWALFKDLPHLGADIIMNGTPVGMAPGASSSPYPRTLLRRGMTVLDAVYDPPLTLLLKNALSRGCRTIAGTELFREQALLQSNMFIRGISGNNRS